MACARVDVNGTDQPHIRFQTDANSTIAHLHTATDMGLQRVGFWVLKQPAYPHYESHYKPIYMLPISGPERQSSSCWSPARA